MHRIFHTDRALFVRAFRTMLDVDFPEPRSVEVVGGDVTDASVLEGHVDSVLLVDTVAGRHVVAVEAQNREDEDKRQAWPFYLAALHKKHGAQVTLLVVCADRSTARWAGKPIEIGLAGDPSQVTYPRVLGPGNVPKVTRTEDAVADVMLAVFSAITHRFSPEVEEILGALADSLTLVDPEMSSDLAELTAVGLAESAAADVWRDIMATKAFKTRTFIDDWRDEGRAEGIAQGRAEALLSVLNVRGIDVPEPVRERIDECRDTDQLSTWIRRAGTATSIDDVIGS